MYRIIDDWSAVKRVQEKAIQEGTDWVRKDLSCWYGRFLVTEDISHHEITVKDLFCLSMTGLGGSEYRPNFGVVRVLGMSVRCSQPIAEDQRPYGSVWWSSGRTDHGARLSRCCIQGIPSCPHVLEHEKPFALTPSDEDCPCWCIYRLPNDDPLCELTLPAGARLFLKLEVQRASPEWGESRIKNDSSQCDEGQAYRGPLDWSGGGKIVSLSRHPLVMPARMSFLSFKYPRCDEALLVEWIDSDQVAEHTRGAVRVCCHEADKYLEVVERQRRVYEHFSRQPRQFVIREGGLLERVDCFGDPLDNFGPVQHA